MVTPAGGGGGDVQRHRVALVTAREERGERFVVELGDGDLTDVRFGGHGSSDGGAWRTSAALRPAAAPGLQLILRDQLGKSQRARTHGALLSGEVHADQTEARVVVTIRPFEVVEQRPVKIPAHVDADPERA